MTTTTTHSPAPWRYEYSPYTLQATDSGIDAAGSELAAFEIVDAGGSKVLDTNEDTPSGLQEANARLATAAPALLAACRMVVARWEHGDLAEAARACDAAVALATIGFALSDNADDHPVTVRPYSVLLLYPDYVNDSGSETFYAFVTAADPITAVAEAQRRAAVAQTGIDIVPDDFAQLLVTEGHHYSEPLFNK